MTPAPSAAPSIAPAPRPAAPAVDPASITGYVRAMAVPENPRGDGQVSELEVVPRDEYLTDLRLVIGKGNAFKLIVPRALPLPVAIGDSLSFQASGSGGGPNWRGNFLLFGADRTLLFAVGTLPPDWTIEQGKRVKSENQGDYIAHDHEVVFAHGGTKVTVQPGKWARFDAGSQTFYVWGAAVERTRTAKGPLPPDYVGGWLDFAIVRAR